MPKDLDAALHKRVPDVIKPGLKILFCGINPGRYSAAAGHHFAGPSNRFWRTLHAAGFTPKLLTPFDEDDLLALGFGITNIVSRATANAAVLTKAELQAGARKLVHKVQACKPQVLAVVGLSAYRAAFEEPHAECGLQTRSIGETRIWLLPNPSGLNAHHQGPALTKLFADLRSFATSPGDRDSAHIQRGRSI